MWNWDMLGGELKWLKGKLLEEWGLLTQDERTAVRGQRDQLLGTLRRYYGLRRAYQEENVSAWTSRLG